jgi:ankyrin repeat protein
MYAANNGHYDAAAALLLAGADADAGDFHGITPLMTAVLAGKPRVVQLLLDSGARIDAQASGNVTALHLAAGIGDLLMVQALLRSGADVSHKTAEGSTPASLALSGPQPVTAHRHAIASLLSGANAHSPPPAQAVHDDHSDDVQEL